MLASSGDEGDEGTMISSDTEESPQQLAKQTNRRPDTKVKAGSAAEGHEDRSRPARPKLLAMKLSESETSDDDHRSRQVDSAKLVRGFGFLKKLS